jgi:hypothetical protein
MTRARVQLVTLKSLDRTPIRSPSRKRREPASSLPSNCITDPVARQELLYSLPRQDHHLATDKNRVAKPQWTEQFEELLWRYYPDRSLNEPWNIVEKMRHRGSHPFAYHQWVYSNLRRALSQSRGDWNQFLRRWNLWVRDVVVADATIARREYWSCFD